MPYDFHPPRPNAFVLRTMYLLYPLVLYARERIVDVRLKDDDRARLATLMDSRLFLLPNHPSEAEPSILVGVARRLGRRFYFVATHELFNGLTGWIVNRMGTFSIRRGYPDRAALRMAERLLVEQGATVVMFPEGETHMRSDAILPIHGGAAYIALRAAKRLSSRGESLPVVPILVRYRCLGDVIPLFVRSIRRLEAAVGLPCAESMPPADRLRRVGIQILADVEQEYALPPVPQATIDERIARLFTFIERRICHAVGVRPPRLEPDGTLAPHLRMRALYNYVFDFRDGLDGATTPYGRRLRARRRHLAAALLADMDRVQNFVAMDEAVLAPPIRPERLGEVLYRLEKEVFGKPLTRPRREAVVYVGNPVDVMPHLPGFSVHRRQAVAALTQDIEKELQRLLELAQSKENTQESCLPVC